ncbi:MAG: guanylate kinase [Flavobacteriales bacterium]|nr:guanylate kinase [Flavobacteriales bacterium]HPF89064.1 guanylate kinase [Flavobacteriales bacterium]
MATPGKCIIISAPSGAGKTTIVRSLLKQGLRLAFSVSATSRAKRSYEVDGQDYFFINAEEFRRRIERDAFIEWEEVYPGQYYGTLRSEIDRIWSNGNSAIFDVDVIGGIDLKRHFGDRALSIFISPPSVSALEERLRARGTESEESLRKRVDKAAHEMTYAPQFDAVVVNDTLEHACAEAHALVARFLGT